MGFFLKFALAISKEAWRDKLTSTGKFKVMTLKLPKTKRIIKSKKLVIGMTIFELEILMILESKNIKTMTMPTMAAGQKVKPFKRVKTNSEIKITAPKIALMAASKILLVKPT